MLLVKLYTSFLVGICIICSSLQMTAQDIHFDIANIRKGLPHNSVTSIIQDAEGYMWFGTRNGLSRYDGYEFINYHQTENEKSLTNNHVTAVMEDHLGVLWVGTANGVTRINKNMLQFDHYLPNDDKEESMSGSFVHTLYQDQMTNIWIATQNGLNKLIRHRNTFIHYPFNEPVHQMISVQNKDREHHLLLATDKGIFAVDMKTEQIRPYPLSQPIDQVTCFHKEGHTLYAGTRNMGVFQIDLRTHTVQPLHANNKQRHFPVTGIEHLNQHELIITTRGNGFFRYHKDNKNTVHYTTRDKDRSNITDNSILSMLISKGNVLWLGTELGGIHKYSMVKASHLFKHDLKNIVINDITAHATSSNNLWLGTDYQGIINYNTETNQYDWHNNIILPSSISALYTDRALNNQIILGTQYSGLYVYNHKKRNTRQLAPEIFNDKTIISIQRSLPGHILVFTKENGIHQFNKQLIYQRAIPSPDENRPGQQILNVNKDYYDQFWIGLNNQSLITMTYNEPHKHYEFHSHQTLNDQIQHNVISVFRDMEEELWISTKGGQTIRYHQAEDKTLPFPGNTELANAAHAFSEDHSGNIWIFTFSGVSKFNKSTGILTHYPIDHFALTFSSMQKAVRFNKNIWIGQNNGLHYFTPENLVDKINKNIPPVVINQIKIINKDNETIDLYSQGLHLNKNPLIELHYQENSFQIEFSALDYSQPDENKYQYRLIGYNDQYVMTDASQRTARYLDLKPGTYTFHVKASNNDNIWNEEGASLKIIISTPFWMMWWFKAFIALIALFAVALLYQAILDYKKNKQEKLNLKETQETLFLKENQLRTLIDNLPDLIYIKDIDSNFVLANKKLAHVMGVQDPEELTGKNDHDYYPKELADQYMMDELTVIERNQSLINRIEPGKDEYGNVIILSTSKVPVTNHKNEVIGIVGIGRDITEIKKAEEKIQEQAESLQETNTLLEERQEEIVQQKEEIEFQRDELEKLNQTKDKFFSIIGHDLKNPFHAIIALSDMLLTNFTELEENEKTEMVSMIKASSENAYNLLQNLLEWSKSQTGNIDFFPEKIKLDEIIDETTSVLAINAQKKHIQVTKSMNKDIMLYADKNMLKTIIRNIISNAIKFTHENGSINITASEKEGNVYIAIQDDGVGMDESLKSKIFSMEKLQSKNGTSGETGTGLGLILCNDFAAKHNGRIQVDSEENKGSCFTIILPSGQY